MVKVARFARADYTTRHALLGLFYTLVPESDERAKTDFDQICSCVLQRFRS